VRRGDRECGEPRRRRLLAGVSTNVMVLGFVSLLTDMSSEMIIPILPLFLVSIGATGLIVGLVEGAAETTASLLKVVSGWYSDRFRKRKAFILAGYGSSAAVKPLLIIAASAWQILGIRIAERVGKGIRSAPRDALIADSTESRYTGRAFGFHKAMDTTGAILGVILLLVVAFVLGVHAHDVYGADDFKVIFAVASIPAFVAVLVIILFVREVPSTKEAVQRTFLKGMRRLGRPFWLLMIVVMFFYLGEVNQAFFILKATFEGESFTVAILLYLMFNIVFAALSTPLGSLSDRLGRKPLIALSFGLFAFTCVTMSVASSLWLLALGFATFGVYKAASEGIFKAYVLDVSVPDELRGTALGAFHTCVGLVMLPGGIVVGLLWDSAGPGSAFLYGAAMAAVSVVLLLFLGPRRGPSPAA
jgi:MFS family permease